MLKLRSPRTDAEWINIFGRANHGHTLWDGNAPDPHNPAHAIRSSRQFLQHSQEINFVPEGAKVLDFGCGNGRLGIALSELNVEYFGIDTDQPCIDFCRSAFDGYPNFHFQFDDVASYPHPNGRIQMLDHKLPFSDGFFDTVIILSVLTHVCSEAVASHYMREMTRVLRPGGKMFSTWYRSPPHPATNSHVRTIFPEAFIINCYQGHKIMRTYGGHSEAYYDQWCLYSQRTSPSP